LNGYGNVRGLNVLGTGEILIAKRRNFELNIDTIEQRTGNSGTIALDLQWSAVAPFL